MKLLRPDIFDLNPRRRISTEKIGEDRHHLVIIDDLFQYPRDVSSLFNELVYTDDEQIRRAAPTYRCSMLFPNRDQIYREVFEQHYQVYGINLISEWATPSGFDQYFDQSPIIKPVSYAPHVDLQERTNYAFVIYMNEQNIHGGTQFLRHTLSDKETSDGSDEVIKQPTTIRFDSPWDYLESEWQRYHLVPMRFNRLVSYRNNLLHGIYTDGSFYRNTPRKTIVGNF